MSASQWRKAMNSGSRALASGPSAWSARPAATIASPAMPAGGSTAARAVPLRQLIVIGLLLLYPWANRLAVAGNLSPVDGLALAGFAAMLLNPAWLTRARTLYTRTPYGAAAFVLAVVFLASLFRTRQFGEPEPTQPIPTACG